MYSADKIIWVKNVKRNKGEGWAYDDVVCGNNFYLNWPTKKKGSASTPQIGDIIVLFQKPNFINGKRNKDVHLTHLVSPVSEDIYKDDDHPDHLWCREVKLIAIATPIYSIPNPGYFNFYKPNRGLTNPIINLETNIGLNEKELKEHLWQLFSNSFCESIENEIESENLPIGVYGEVEGDSIIRKHLKQEYNRRSSNIVHMAKKLAYIQGNGRILCEVCDFDFVHYYGLIGKNFIECHHKHPISEGKRITKISDLALVCSNCHRMLHRQKNDGKYHTIRSLKKLINRTHT